MQRKLVSKSVLDGRRAFPAAAITLALALVPASAAFAGPSTIAKQPGAKPITVVAAPGTQNKVSVSYGAIGTNPDGTAIGGHFISDSGGLFVIPGEGQLCSQPSGNTTSCADTTGPSLVPGETGAGESIEISLGNLADTFVSDNVGNMEVRGGTGNDSMQGTSREIGASPEFPELGGDSAPEYLYGDAGNDRLSGNGGDDTLVGGKGRDKLRGGPGSDILDAKDGQKDKQINCGPGKGDKAFFDKIDPRPISC
jgi:Ca2+-binding RTX toxin-like protein